MEQIPVQPLAIGLAGGIAGFELIIPYDAALPGVHQEDLTRLQTGFFYNLVWRQLQHPHLGGENELAVAGNVVAGGPQAVAVQDRPHHVAV